LRPSRAIRISLASAFSSPRLETGVNAQFGKDNKRMAFALVLMRLRKPARPTPRRTSKFNSRLGGILTYDSWCLAYAQVLGALDFGYGFAGGAS
jgi:hypothetical protein